MLNSLSCSVRSSFACGSHQDSFVSCWLSLGLVASLECWLDCFVSWLGYLAPCKCLYFCPTQMILLNSCNSVAPWRLWEGLVHCDISVPMYLYSAIKLSITIHWLIHREVYLSTPLIYPLVFFDRMCVNLDPKLKLYFWMLYYSCWTNDSFSLDMMVHTQRFISTQHQLSSNFWLHLHPLQSFRRYRNLLSLPFFVWLWWSNLCSSLSLLP